MIKLKIAAASTVTFVALLLVWSKISEKGYETIMPKLEQQQQQVLENREKFDELVREDMAGLGASPSEQMENTNQPASEGNPGVGMPSRQLKPLGTWTGVRNGGSDNLAYMKFDRENYSLWIKYPAGEDVKEKGEYEFEFDMIHFKPRGKSAYYMEYYMISKREIQLSGYNYYFTFEKDDNVAFDF
jgi:hypothetical protein